MADYFGYNKTAKGPGNIVSTSMVLVAIGGGGGSVKLAQQVTIQYQRQITPQYEVGSDSVYMVAGQSSGTWAITRAVGETGLLKPYKPGDACSTTTLSMSKGNGVCGMEPGVITGTGCILQSVGIQAAVASTIVTDNAQWMVGSLSD
jgi:hypothetical protein